MKKFLFQVLFFNERYQIRNKLTSISITLLYDFMTKFQVHSEIIFHKTILIKNFRKRLQVIPKSPNIQ